MGLIITDVGCEMVLGAYFNNTWPGAGKNLTIHLNSNNVSPSDTDTAGTYTETTVTGGSAKTLTNGSWTVSITGNISQVLYAQQTWTFTANFGDTIYGYYVLDADSNLVWAEKLAAAFTPANNGDQLLITPKFQMSKGTPT